MQVYKEPTFEEYKEILSSQSKKKLEEFIISLVIENRGIGRKLELEFCNNPENEIKLYKSIIRESIKQNSRRGYVDYENVYDAVQGANTVLERARILLEEGKSSRVLDTCLCVLHEMLPFLQNADDSDGYIGGVISEALEIINEMCDFEALGNESKELFDKLLKESNNHIYDGWGEWKLSLLSSCINVTSNNEEREKLERHIELLVKNDDSDGSYSRYLLEELENLKYHIICKFDGKNKANEYIYKNLHLPEFRQRAIENALEKKNYDEVEKLAMDGEKQDKELLGLVKKWREYRYSVYKKTKQLDKQRTLALQLAVDDSFEHYKELKSTYSADEWETIYPDIIKKLRKDDRYYSIYANVLIEEKETRRLLDFVKEEPARIMYYYKNILPLYREEVGDLFEKVILDNAKNASDRKKYQDICSKLKLIAKEGYSDLAKKLVVQFMEMYARKPAFMDELRKM